MKLQVILLTSGLVGVSALASAQQTNEQYYQEQQQQQQQVLNAEQQRSGYLHSQDQQQAQQPSGYWEKTWGAIAPSPVGGVLGTAVGASSQEQAESLALADCKEKGGGACEVGLSYHNQCAAMVIGAKNLRMNGAESLQLATQLAMNACEASDTSCRVYYSACTEPKWHQY